jgi:hypothetical protein
MYKFEEGHEKMIEIQPHAEIHLNGRFLFLQTWPWPWRRRR